MFAQTYIHFLGVKTYVTPSASYRPQSSKSLTVRGTYWKKLYSIQNKLLNRSVLQSIHPIKA